MNKFGQYSSVLRAAVGGIDGAAGSSSSKSLDEGQAVRPQDRSELAPLTRAVVDRLTAQSMGGSATKGSSAADSSSSASGAGATDAMSPPQAASAVK